MKALRKTIFISDLHLDEKCSLSSERFVYLLNNLDKSVESLYILGDLFETWIGDDEQTFFYAQIKRALQIISKKGIRIYFLPGNRDFLIGRKFLEETGCQLLPDETKVILYNTPVLLMHGDTLCTEDLSYLRFRQIIRCPLSRVLFLLLPLVLRRNIANKIRQKSKQHTRSAEAYQMDVTQTKVEEIMQQHQVYFLIHGHTHRSAIHH